jgi:hypothetical protein
MDSEIFTADQTAEYLQLSIKNDTKVYFRQEDSNLSNEES